MKRVSHTLAARVAQREKLRAAQREAAERANAILALVRARVASSGGRSDD